MVAEPSSRHQLDSVVFRHCWHSTWQGVCNGSVSVCLSDLSISAAACGGFAARPQAGDIAGAPYSRRRSSMAHSNSSTAVSITVDSSKCKQCHVCGRRRRLNTDLLFMHNLNECLLQFFWNNVINAQLMCYYMFRHCLTVHSSHSRTLYALSHAVHGAGGAMFSDCPSVRACVRALA